MTETTYQWNPTLMDPPKDLRAWYFNSPDTWPPFPPKWRPTPGWRPDPTWPPAPAGWIFWIERWHGYLFLGSLIMACFGVGIAIANAQQAPAAVPAGLAILALVVAAGWISRFWSRVNVLPGGRKALVWMVALPGMAFGLCLIVSLWIFGTVGNSRR